MALTDKLTTIADAIRGKTGGTEALTLDGMATAISGIETGGGDGSPFDWEVTEYVHSEDWLDSTLGLASNFCNLYCNTSADGEWAAYYCEVTNNTATQRAAMRLACITYGSTVCGGISERTEGIAASSQSVSNAVGAGRAFYLSAGSIITVHKIILAEG